MSIIKFSCSIYHLLFIVSVYSLTLDDIQSFERISCRGDIDCPETLTCDVNRHTCQYPTYYCLGVNNCTETSSLTLHPHSQTIYTQIMEGTNIDNDNNNDDDIDTSLRHEVNELIETLEMESSPLPNTNTMIMEGCPSTATDCITSTPSCTQSSDCFTHQCDGIRHQCLLSEELPVYFCYNSSGKDQEAGAMICGKYLEESCTGHDECATHYCSTTVHRCQFPPSTPLSSSSSPSSSKFLTHAPVELEMPQPAETGSVNDSPKNSSGPSTTTLLKEMLILLFIILPVIVLTQYIKSTKFIKRVKRNRTPFEYKKVLVEELSNC